jgi:hypothetical protein
MFRASTKDSAKVKRLHSTSSIFSYSMTISVFQCPSQAIIAIEITYIVSLYECQLNNIDNKSLLTITNNERSHSKFAYYALCDNKLPTFSKRLTFEICHYWFLLIMRRLLTLILTFFPSKNVGIILYIIVYCPEVVNLC